MKTRLISQAAEWLSKSTLRTNAFTEVWTSATNRSGNNVDFEHHTHVGRVGLAGLCDPPRHGGQRLKWEGKKNNTCSHLTLLPSSFGSSLIQSRRSDRRWQVYEVKGELPKRGCTKTERWPESVSKEKQTPLTNHSIRTSVVVYSTKKKKHTCCKVASKHFQNLTNRFEIRRARDSGGSGSKYIKN